MSSLALLNQNLPALNATPEGYEEIIKSFNFAPRLGVHGSNSEQVKAGKLNVGAIGLIVSKEDVRDLGKSIDILPLDVRFKAVKYPQDDSPIIESYDFKSETFKKIKYDADNIAGLNGNQYGPEYLVWIPSQQTFATMYLANKSSRNAATPVQAALRKTFLNMKSEFIKTAKYSWHAPKFEITTQIYDTPEFDVLNAKILEFQATKPAEREAVTDTRAQ